MNNNSEKRKISKYKKINKLRKAKKFIHLGRKNICSYDQGNDIHFLWYFLRTNNVIVMSFVRFFAVYCGSFKPKSCAFFSE